jgi:predicted nucleic acid-binding protein
MFFVDTNVLLYAASNAAEDQSKREAARAAPSGPDIGFSAQALREFYAVAVVKQRLQMTHDEALAALQSLAPFPVCPITREWVLAAVGLRQRYQISYWDAAILAAAKQMGCATVFSEDLNPRQEHDGVSVVNPFTQQASQAPP